MKTRPKKIDREAVARSMRELEMLYGRKPLDRNEIAPQQRGEGATLILNKEMRNES